MHCYFNWSFNLKHDCPWHSSSWISSLVWIYSWSKRSLWSSCWSNCEWSLDCNQCLKLWRSLGQCQEIYWSWQTHCWRVSSQKEIRDSQSSCCWWYCWRSSQRYKWTINQYFDQINGHHLPCIWWSFRQVWRSHSWAYARTQKMKYQQFYQETLKIFKLKWN